MRCVQNKWGAGTCSGERPTGNSTEQEKSLQAMLAERAKQDAKWLSVSETETVPVRYTGTIPTRYTSPEPKHQPPHPSSSGTGQYGSSLR
jgi:hypothetical protein